MACRRCSSCAANWPTSVDKYRLCPECKGKTDYVSSSEPMPHSEVMHRLFEVYCRDRDAEREEQMASFEAAVAATPTIPDPGEVPADEQPQGD